MTMDWKEEGEMSRLLFFTRTGVNGMGKEKKVGMVLFGHIQLYQNEGYHMDKNKSIYLMGLEELY